MRAWPIKSARTRRSKLDASQASVEATAFPLEWRSVPFEQWQSGIPDDADAGHDDAVVRGHHHDESGVATTVGDTEGFEAGWTAVLCTSVSSLHVCGASG